MTTKIPPALILTFALILAPAILTADDSLPISQWCDSGFSGGPWGVAVDYQGYTYVTWTDAVQRLAPDGTVIAQWGSSGSGPGQFNNPRGIAVDPQGNVFVADTHNNRVQSFTPDGTYRYEWGAFGTEPGYFDLPFGIATDDSGYVYTTELSANSRVQKFTNLGSPVAAWPTIDLPQGIDIAPNGDIFVAIYWDDSVQRLSASGAVLDEWNLHSKPEDTQYVTGLGLDPDGFVWVIFQMYPVIRKFTQAGVLVDEFGLTDSHYYLVGNSHGLAVSDQGEVVVADFRENCLVTFSTDVTPVRPTTWGLLKSRHRTQTPD